MVNSGRVIDLNKDSETRRRYGEAVSRMGVQFEKDRDERERERANAYREAKLRNPFIPRKLTDSIR